MLETASMRLKKSFSFSRSKSQTLSDQELLEQLQQLVPDSTIDLLVDTGEVDSREGFQLERTLKRYLAAQKNDVEGAAKRLIRHAKWRRDSLPPGGIILEEEIKVHLELKKAILQPAGAKGRPLLVAVARRHEPGNIQELERFIVFCLEAASRYCFADANPDNKIWILVDLSGLALKNLDAAALRSCFTLLNQHYPEHAGGIIMYKAPAIFSGIWTIVSPFIDPATRAKIKWVKDDAQALEVIDECVGLDVVPREYGGRARAVPIEEAVRRLQERGAAAINAGPEPAAENLLELLQPCRVCAAVECCCEAGVPQEAGTVAA